MPSLSLITATPDQIFPLLLTTIFHRSFSFNILYIGNPKYIDKWSEQALAALSAITAKFKEYIVKSTSLYLL